MALPAMRTERVPTASVCATAEVIGRRLHLPVETVPTKSFGPLGPIFAMDQPSSSARTRSELGWEPTRPNPLADLENLPP